MRPKTDIGIKIAWCAAKKGMTLARLAEESGIAFNTLSYLIRGRTVDPKLSTVQALAKTLGVSVDYLTTVGGNEKPRRGKEF